jgi:quercetin dioxygenase-like cupin family protein
LEDDMKRLLMVLGVVALAMGAGALARAAAAARFQFWDPSDMKFKESATGIELGKAWGDPDKGEFGMIVKYRAGAERGWHSHSSPIHLVMISGTLVFEGEGTAPQELGPGSGVTEPAKIKHNARCKEGADCVFVISGTKRYDFLPAKEKTAEK